MPSESVALPEAPAPAQARTGAPLLLVLLACSYCFAYFDRLLMAVVAEPVKRDFGFSDKQLSLLTGAAFVLIYGAAGIPSGWLIDRFNRKTIVGVAVALWSVGTMTCGFAGSFAQLALSRAAVGISESAAVPAAMSIIADTYAPERRPLAIGLFYAGGMVGIFGCFMLGGWVASAYGWRWAFMIAGPPGILLAILVMLLAREPGREPLAVPAAERGEATFSRIWANRPLIWTISAGSVVTFVNVGLVNWLASFFIRSHGMSLRDVGLIFGPVMAGGMAAGLVGGGWIGNRLASGSVRRLIWFSAAITFSLVPLYLLIFTLSNVTAALVATFVGTCASVIYSPSYTAAWQALAVPDTRGTVAGISGFLNALIGGAFCSFFVGALSDHWRPLYGADSLRYAMMVGMVFCLISGAMFVRAARLVRC